MSVSRILPDLYVGDGADCASWPHMRICVHEGGCDRGCLQMPILHAVAPTDRRVREPEMRASRESLERIAAMYESSRMAGPVLIHCGAGIERSPLAAAYILVTRYGMTWDAAYALIVHARPMVQNRMNWLA